MTCNPLAISVAFVARVFACFGPNSRQMRFTGEQNIFSLFYPLYMLERLARVSAFVANDKTALWWQHEACSHCNIIAYRIVKD